MWWLKKRGLLRGNDSYEERELSPSKALAQTAMQRGTFVTVASDADDVDDADLSGDVRVVLTATNLLEPASDARKQELVQGRFTIGGPAPGQKVSWQVTGNRSGSPRVRWEHPLRSRKENVVADEVVAVGSRAENISVIRYKSQYSDVFEYFEIDPSLFR
jgi:hypothetical protein